MVDVDSLYSVVEINKIKVKNEDVIFHILYSDILINTPFQWLFQKSFFQLMITSILYYSLTL